MYRGYICQHKTLIFLISFFFLCSCAVDDSFTIPETGAKAVWSDSPKRFDFRGAGGEAIAHPFFDLLPFSSLQDNSINFYPLSAPSSDALYRLDLVSGKRVKEKSFCPMKDLWGKYNKELFKPNFTWGMVPRLIDQLGNIQNIVVFGNKDFYDDYDYSIIRSHRVRVVGGLLEQFCGTFPCERNSSWKSRIILVAVDKNDPEYRDVYDFTGLKEKIDWTYFHSFLENIHGGTNQIKKIVPNYRVVGDIEPQMALKIAVKKGHLFRFEEMQSLKNSCHKLYDYVWEFSVKSHKFQKFNFNEEFAKFYKKHSNQYKTCMKFVRPADLNFNLNRFWFFAHFNAYMQLENQGQIFDCHTQVWARNARKTDGSYVFPYNKNVDRCSIGDLNKAFSSAPTMLKALGLSSYYSYARFVEYDTGSHGSHDRIFNWIVFDGKHYSCNNKKYLKIDETVKWFPEDVNWLPYETKNKFKSLRYKKKNGKEIK